MKRHSLVIGIICLLIPFVAATSRGDEEPIDEAADTPVDDTTEPITGAAVMPEKGAERPMKDPFTPYDIGGPEAAWSYDQLADEEKVVVDHAKADDQSAVQAAYAVAAADRAELAKAEAAAIQLGAGSLAEGAVP